MPNWVQSYVEFTGDQANIEKVFDKIKCLNNNDRDNVFDFNRLVPMPKSLNIECSSQSNLAYAFYMLAEYDTIPHSVYMDRKTVLERIKNEDDKSKIELLKLGKQIKDNVDKYGASDWYIWCVKNWGTKWNACEAFRNNSSLYFQTAWSWPEHIMYKLAELCHRYDVDFSGKWADEDCGNNTGEFYTEEGELYYNHFDSGSSCAYEVYVDCWGESECIGQTDSGEYFHYECARGECPNYANCYGKDDEE